MAYDTNNTWLGVKINSNIWFWLYQRNSQSVFAKMYKVFSFKTQRDRNVLDIPYTLESDHGRNKSRVSGAS